MQVATPKKGYKLVKTSFGKYEEIPEEWEVSQLKELIDFQLCPGAIQFPISDCSILTSPSESTNKNWIN